jgi:hypothetical protein
MPADDETLYRMTLRRGLARADLSNLPLHFEVGVLQRYLEAEAQGFSIIRSNTVGRLKKQGGWALDFGISEDESMVHICLGDIQNLPPDDQEHWASHAMVLSSSATYLQMRMSPGSCLDDGDIRPWQS